MQKRAFIVGATGIAGGNLAAHLAAQGDWEVFGAARRPATVPGIHPVAVDVLDPAAVEAALQAARPTHLFLTAWLRQPTEAENIRVNSAMVRHVLRAAGAAGTVEHVALVTGLKHYLGPFEAYAQGAPAETPFREEQPRLPIENFYYAQEDELFAGAARDGYSWSVHRPHTIVGYALGNAMNLGSTLAVYASLARERGLPLIFPGSMAQWAGLTDMTDAALLAEHLAWAATTPAARNEAFNIVNGDIFRWRWLWPQVAAWFGVEAAPFSGAGVPLAQQLAGAGPAWAALAARHGLAEPAFDRLASPWHTDADLGRPLETVTDMAKSRRLGFTGYRETRESLFALFARLRAERLIP